jgi:hypothetical protein
MLAPAKCEERKCKSFIGVSQPDGTEDSERYYCKAFPEGIPFEIVFGNNAHTKPFPGDNGIQYESK